VAGRTGNVVLTTSDVVGLSDALSAVSVDVVDGGDYVGVVVSSTPAISITAQPQSTSVTINSANEVASTLPSGTWGPVSRANGKWFVSGWQSTQADYIAVSDDGATWTKRSGLPSAGAWSAIQYQNGVYATQYGNTVAYSSDATTWSSDTFTDSRNSIFGAGGKFLRATKTAIYTSTDAHSWTQTASNTSSTYTRTFAYAGGTWFVTDQAYGIRASANATTWSSFPSFSTGGFCTNAVAFGSDVYLGFTSSTPLRYSSGSFDGAAGSYGSTGGQFATSGSVLVLYAYTGKIYTSTNGTTWVERPLPVTIPSQNIGQLFYAGEKFVLALQYQLSGGTFTIDPGTVYLTSSNGVDWTQNTRTYPSYSTQWAYTANGYFANQSSGAFNYLQIGSSTAVASLSVSAYYSANTITYQWQVSTDAGSTWSNVSGATSATLSLSVTAADNGKRYRCVLSATGASSVTSNSATLTVT
jgi:hypothetical protein